MSTEHIHSLSLDLSIQSHAARMHARALRRLCAAESADPAELVEMAAALSRSLERELEGLEISAAAIERLASFAGTEWSA